MSVLDGLSKFPLDIFGGENQRGERTDTQPQWALSCPGVEFEPGLVRTRLGYYLHPSSAFQESNKVSGAYNHLYANQSWVFRAIQAPATSVSVNYAQYNGSGAVTNAAPYSTATPGYGTFAGFGKRVYFALSNAATNSGQLGAVDIAAVSVPKVWLPALRLTDIGAVTAIFGGPGSGSVTLGLHSFFLLVQSKTGFITRVSPVTSLIGGIIIGFVQGSASNNDSLSISIAAPGGGWSTDIDNMTLVATTSTNQAKKYIVPGTKFTITNPANPVTFTFNIADVTLATQVTATQYESVMYTGLGQTDPTVQPIQPYYAFQCGERLGLFFVDPNFGPAMAFSKPSQYEFFTFDRNIIYLPGIAKPLAGKWSQGTIYIYSEVGTFAYLDSGSDPVTWSPPRVVDSKIGTPTPYGITVDTTGYGFVADVTGLYAFAGGQYYQQPITYYQPNTWNSIDWSDPSFSMVDDKANWKLVICCKDLGGVRRVFTWNYVEGYVPTSVKFSEHLFTPAMLWAVAVKNYGDAQSSLHRTQLWLQSGTSGRWTCNRNSLDPTPYRDTDVSGIYGIRSGYRTAFLPPQVRDYQLQQHHYEQLRILGAGSFNLNLYGLDDTIFVQASDTTGTRQNLVLATAPGKETLVGYSVISEAVSAEIAVAIVAIDTWFEISHWSHYYKGYAMRRGN